MQKCFPTVHLLQYVMGLKSYKIMQASMATIQLCVYFEVFGQLWTLETSWMSFRTRLGRKWKWDTFVWRGVNRNFTRQTLPAGQSLLCADRQDDHPTCVAYIYATDVGWSSCPSSIKRDSPTGKVWHVKFLFTPLQTKISYFHFLPKGVLNDIQSSPGSKVFQHVEIYTKFRKV